MAILLVHLDKKVAISSETLDQTIENIKSLEDSKTLIRYNRNPVNLLQIEVSYFYVLVGEPATSWELFQKN